MESARRAPIRILPAVVTLLFLVAIALGVLMVDHTRARLARSQGESLAASAAMILNELEQFLIERRGDLTVLSAIPYESGQEVLSKRLAEVRSAYPFYSWIAVVDLQGKLVWTSDPNRSGADYTKEAWFRLAKSGTREYLGSAAEGSGASALDTVRMAGFLKDSSGELRAILIAEAKLPQSEQIVAHLKSTHAGSEPMLPGRWDIMRADGRFLHSARDASERPNRSSAAFEAHLHAMLGKNGIADELDPETGRRSIAAYASTPAFEREGGGTWTVRVAMDRADALAETNRFIVVVVIGAACLVLPMGGVAIWSAFRLRSEWESIARRDRRLAKQYRALARLAHSQALREGNARLGNELLCKTAATTMQVSRASIWYYDETAQALICANLYDAATGEHSNGSVIRAAEFPRYFQALAAGRTIPAEDAVNDPATSEFTESYLRPLGIGALLDAPIWSGGNLLGVVCHEHVGNQRRWTMEEQSFAAAIADLTALNHETAQRIAAETALREAQASLEQKVTERTRELADANERLLELDRLKSEFLATMSHELRTPLNSIIGFTGILRQGLAGPLNDEQAKQLKMVHFSARHLLNLINDLLDLSRIESGRMDFHITRFDVQKVVTNVAESLVPMLADKPVRLETDVDPRLPEIRSDEKKVFQILLNLANNAVKFTDTGSVRIRVGGGDDRITFAVQDTGIGIREDQIGYLFEAFRQADGSARRVYEGTGLGLYLCKKLVGMLGGTIHVTSTAGEGSTFTFEIPTEFQNSP